MTFELKAQTHFSQGWNTSLLDAVGHFELDGIRDSLPWNLIETARGSYDFGGPKTAWLDSALARGLDVTLVFAHANALYDGGKSVHTDAGRAAFADYVVATLQHYPNVTSIEIGNEYNSTSFVTGPVASASMAERAVYYAKLIKAVGSALDAAGIDVEVLGGATHSIPVDYFAVLRDHGALEHIDAVSIHPYTTPPEQFADQIAVLRGVIGDDMPITVTEFGQHFESLADAPAYLAKMVSVMGAAGIEGASWYALARQSWFPNMELWDPASGETPAGAALKTIEDLLDAGGEISRIAVDEFTYLYSFGGHAALLWGADGKVALAPGTSAFDLLGNPIEDFDGRLSHDVPIILRSAATITAASIAVDHGGLVGDSFDQFDLTNEAGGTSGFEGPWSYYAESGAGKITALYTMGGGLKSGEPWTPYLGTNWLRPLQVSAASVTPVDFATGSPNSKYAVVERYTVAKDGIYDLKGHFDVDDATTDGVTLQVRVNGSEILVRDIYDIASGHVFDLDIQDLALAAGDHVDFVIGSRSSPKGDTTSRHIQIFEDSTAAQFKAALPGSAGTVVVPRSSLDFSERTQGVQLNLKSMIATVGGERTRLSERPDIVIGSRQSDRLLGDDGRDELHGGAGDDKLFGNGGDDILYGGAGKDRIDGGEGADWMAGGAGNDIYIVDNVGDVVFEDGPATDVDTVESTISYRLGGNIERLYLRGEDDIDGFGNELANLLRGNAGDNVLSGGAGSDRLHGGAGADIFRFEAFDAPGEFDTILDFAVGEDRISLNSDVFANLRALDDGTLSRDQFAYEKALTADHHLIYNTRKGALYYDPDGSGAQQAVLIAKLSHAPVLDAADIIVV